VDIIRVSGSEAVQIAQRVFWPQVCLRSAAAPAGLALVLGRHQYAVMCTCLTVLNCQQQGQP
jgi:hypothetical protein